MTGQLAKDITGQRFGAFVVLRRAGRDESGRALWRVRCRCGNERAMRSDALRRKPGCSSACKRSGA